MESPGEETASLESTGEGPISIADSEGVQAPRRRNRKSAPRRTRTAPQHRAETIPAENVQKEAKPAQVKREESIWKFGTSQIVQGLLGAAAYVIVGLIGADMEMDLKISILIFSSLAFGPWVGLITGVIGQVLYTLLRLM